MGTMGRFIGFVISLVLLLTLPFAAAARTQQGQHHSAIRSDDADSDINRLNTYYFDATKPHIELSNRGSSRPERTSLLVKLWQPSVTTFMPVVTPQPSGMTHSVSNTWQALKVGIQQPSEPCQRHKWPSGLADGSSSCGD
jgi:hypothetical protein